MLFLSRFNKTLKLKLARFMTHGKKARWCDVLQDVVTSYNNTYHRSIKMKPTDVKPGLTESLAWRNQFETQTPPAEQGHYRFKTGDMVRVSHLARAFKREYDQRWSTEVFRVRGRQRRGRLLHLVRLRRLDRTQRLQARRSSWCRYSVSPDN